MPGRTFRLVDARRPEPAPSRSNSGLRNWPASAEPAGEPGRRQRAAVGRVRPQPGGHPGGGPARPGFAAAAPGACGRRARRRPGRGLSRSPGGRKPSATWDDLVLPERGDHAAAPPRRPGPRPGHGAAPLGLRREHHPRQRHHRAVRRPVGHGQVPRRRGHRRRARADAVPGRPVRRGEQVHRRDRTEPAPGVRRRRRGRLHCCSSTRPTRCSGGAARSRTATTATPTSRSTTSCSGWRTTGAWPS